MNASVPDTLPAITTVELWRGAGLLTVVAIASLAMLTRVVPAHLFARLRRAIPAAAFIVWAGIWFGVLAIYWQPVYRYVFPASIRWFLPLIMGTGFGVAYGFLFRLVARVPGHATLLFVLLAGLLGPMTHAWAVYRGIVEKPPVLRGASPVAAIVVSYPEFTIYACLAVLLAAGFFRLFSAIAPRA